MKLGYGVLKNGNAQNDSKNSIGVTTHYFLNN
jgi:hypothetical protein